MKKYILFFFLFLSVVSLSAQEKPQKIKKNSLLFVEVGYLSDSPFKNVKYKIAVQHTFWKFVELSTGYWHYSDQYIEYGHIKSKIALNSFDFSVGLVPVYTFHNFFSLGAGYSYGHINKSEPLEIQINETTGEVKVLLTEHMNKWKGGWHFYLQYHYNFDTFFVGTGLYYYSFNDIDNKPSFSGFNANIVFGIRF